MLFIKLIWHYICKLLLHLQMDPHFQMRLQKSAFQIHFLPVSGCSAEWNECRFLFFDLWFGSLGCMRKETLSAMTWSDGQFYSMSHNWVLTKTRLPKFNKTTALFGIKKAIYFSFYTWLVWKLNAVSIEYLKLFVFNFEHNIEPFVHL